MQLESKQNGLPIAHMLVQVPFYLQKALHFVHKWENHRSMYLLGYMKIYPCSSGINKLFLLQGKPFQSELAVLLFFPPFSLSDIWNFEEDGNVILRAIFKFSGIDLTVLRINLVSIKFTLSVDLKKTEIILLHCKEFKPHGMTHGMGW